jgi:glycosyltransferase involved in cell wall biosynthesis
MSDDAFDPNAKPMGGTELLEANIRKALPELTDQVQIMMSRPENYTFEDKPRVLILQDLPQDPASAVLRDPTYRTQFNRIVFVSHWQQQQYNQYLGIPYSEGLVIKNGVPHRAAVLPKPKQDGKLRFMYTSTPHRGLAILTAAAAALAKERQDWELHVYSSFKIYGWENADEQFKPVFDALKANPCVVYHGTQENSIVRGALMDSHVFVYPSIYAETSCMAIQEALMSGCLAITTNFGALPETAAEWAWMFEFDERPEVMITRTLGCMRRAIDTYDDEHIHTILKLQSIYYQQFYSFEGRVESWKHLLKAVISEGTPVQKLVIE